MRIAFAAATLMLATFAGNGICQTTINVPADQPTIQAGIDAAVFGDEVVVAPGTYFEAVNFNGKAITVRGTDPLDSAVVAATIINGNGAPNVVQCVSGEGLDTLLSGLTITGGNASGIVGGGMYILNSSPTVSHCVFTTNAASFGGGLAINGGSPEINQCEFSFCSAASGGGVYNTSGSTTMTGCIFEGNVASTGAGMYNSSGNPILIGCEFTTNTADGDGGGLFNSLGGLMIIDGTFTGNTTTDGRGGGIYSLDGDLEVSNSAFVANESFSPPTIFSGKGEGGGIYHQGGTITVNGSTLSGNTSANIGGGLYINDTVAAVTDVTFDGNTSERIAAGAFLRASNSTFTGCTFNNNRVIFDDPNSSNSGLGGALYAVSSINTTISSCSFTDNRAALRGGAIFMALGPMTITDCDFQRNVAYLQGDVVGGAIYFQGGASSQPRSSLTIIDSAFSENTATFEGGAIAALAPFANFGADFSIEGSTFTGNAVQIAPGQNFGGRGGGIWFFGVSLDNTFVLTTSTFIENSADRTGGGLYVYTNREITVSGCRFERNSSGEDGGGLYIGRTETESETVVVSNSLFVENSATGAGGGLASTAGSTNVFSPLRVLNSTFVGNTAPAGGANLFNSDQAITVANSIFRGSEPDQIRADAAVLMIHSNVQGGYAGRDNIDADPLFVDPSGGDYSLAPGSPSIDAGDNTLAPSDTLDLDGDGDTFEAMPFDLAGNPRFLDDTGTPDTGVPGFGYPNAVIDMGAFEFQGTSPNICLADTNNDGILTPTDFTAWINAFNNNLPECDQNGDGNCTPTDFTAWIANYNAGCG
jgi:fibronectin-binding autotransporter adhesin